MDRSKQPVAGRLGSYLLDVTGVLTLLFLLLPLVVIVPMSFTAAGTLKFPPPSWSTENYTTFLSDSGWQQATLNTVQVGLFATLIAVLVATPAAYAVSVSRIRGKGLVQLVVMLPLVVPLIVVAVATYSYFAPRGLADSIFGLSLVHGLLGVPMAFLAINSSFEQFDRTQLIASQSLGAKPIVTFIRVVLPAVRPGILTGGLFAFVFSFNEVVTAIFLGGPNSETLPKRMWDGILIQVDPVIAVVATLMILFTVSLMGGALLVRAAMKRAKT